MAKKGTKKEWKRFKELFEKARDTFVDCNEFYPEDYLGKKEAKEFLRLNEKDYIGR